MNWDCCLFCDEKKVKNCEEELKHHPKKNQTKRRKKLKKLARKLFHNTLWVKHATIKKLSH